MRVWESRKTKQKRKRIPSKAALALALREDIMAATVRGGVRGR